MANALTAKFYILYELSSLVLFKTLLQCSLIFDIIKLMNIFKNKYFNNNKCLKLVIILEYKQY